MLRCFARLIFAYLLLLMLPASYAAKLVVSSASSLSDAFQEIGKSFEASHPNTKILFNFAASDVLLQQIVQGAPVDVFAAADEQAMEQAITKHVIQQNSQKNFARNQIVLIVPTDTRLAIQTLTDLTKPFVKRIAYGNPRTVPVGRYTKAVLQQANLWDNIAAKGITAENARQALAYVASAEVEAGFVFATDAAIMPNKVRTILTVPSSIPVNYPIAITADSKQSRLATQFIAYVLSPAGQAILHQHGFLKPND